MKGRLYNKNEIPNFNNKGKNQKLKPTRKIDKLKEA